MRSAAWLVSAFLLAGCIEWSEILIDKPPADWSKGHWQVVVAKPDVSLRGLSVVGSRIVWVAGSGGTLLRSTDGGASFREVAPPDARQCDFRDVHAFDADTAVAMVAGQPARLYRTADGGRSWAIVHADPRAEAFFDALAFEGDIGFLLGDPLDGAFTVLRSDDRGITWRVMPGPHAVAGEAAFAASGTCLDVGPDGVRFVTGGAVSRCLTSRDGGATWTAVDLPLASGKPSMGAFGLAGNGQDLVAVGGDYSDPAASAGTASRSFDGGKSFWPVQAPGARGYRSAAAFLSPDEVLAVGERGASISADRGKSWAPFGDLGFHAVVAGAGAVFACGAGGRVARLWPGR
jgi:photosystem II stability/assembly factor-like uncharacterized protein